MLRYLKGETIPLKPEESAAKGWQLVQCGGYSWVGPRGREHPLKISIIRDGAGSSPQGLGILDRKPLGQQNAGKNAGKMPEGERPEKSLTSPKPFRIIEK